MKEVRGGFQGNLKFAHSDFEANLKLDKCPEVEPSDFRVLGVLGFGGYATVFKARSKRFGVVAVKSQPIFQDNVPNEKAVMERRYLHAMDNRFILKGLAHFRDQNDLFLVTPYAPFGTYRRLMYCRNERLVKPFYAQLVCALQYLHAAKITHGDVKPENMLLFKGGHLKLCDFGLAQTGVDGLVTIYGTREYRSPELILGIPHGSASDWWAFGVMMYEQLIGKHPYHGDSLPVVALKELLSKPLEALKDKLPVTLEAEDIIRRTMEMDPAQRAGRDEAGIQAIVEHRWFGEVDFALFSNEESVIPEFEQFKLKELQAAPPDSNTF